MCLNMASVKISVYPWCLVCASGLICLVSGGFSGVSLRNSLGYYNASLGRQVRGTVSQKREEVWLYNYPWSQSNKTNAIRVRVECKGAACKQEHPLLFVARQQRSVLSWSLPEENYNYLVASRTLCPILDTGLAHKHGQDGFQQFSIDVSSSSPVPVNYTLEADVVTNFELVLNETMSVIVDPAQPVYFLWSYPERVDTVVVKAESDDAHLCVIFSIQGTKCPVYDLARNVEFTGYFQTMTTKAAITMERSDFGSGEFYVVAIVKSSDEECITGERFAPLRKEQPETIQFSKSKVSGHATRRKTIRITVVPTLSSKDYVKAIALPIAFFGAFYVVAFSILLITWCRQKGSRERSLRSILMPRDSDIQDGPLNAPLRTSSSRISRDHHYGSTPQVIGDEDSISQHDSLEHEHEPLTTTDGLKDLERNYDMLQDIDQEKDIYRLRTSLMLTDLAKKEKKYLKKKYRLYHWNLLMIAVFYALPVVQLVITYQKVLNFSGDEDICYYNFFCAHPLGYLSAFNNVYSNIGYVMLGFLFFLLVLRRDRQYKQEVSANREVEMYYGIPQHYAIFYAMALALVMEGVLSGCYHVCPNNSNFQFDTSFMYIITCLGIVKLYQTRHPDIAANAHSVYAGFAVLIFIAVIGVVYSSFAFWATFCVIHIFGCLYLSSQLYYMGRVKFDAGMFARVFVLLRYDCCSCPVYKDRMLLLVIANIVNWVFAIYGVVARPNDFATYLLAILIVNGLLYLAFYVIMKLRNKERILLFPLFFLGFTLVCWVAALIFFLSNLTSWQKSPAQSRQGNKECILLGFYDDHDVWHFLSACALFLSFLGLLTLDDDLLRTPRNNIPVF